MVRNLGYSYDVVGYLLSLFEVAGLIGPLLVARYVDTRGTMKYTLLVCIALTGVGVGIITFSSSLLMTIVGLVLLAFFTRSTLPIMDTYTNNRFNGDAQKYTILRATGTFGFVFFSLLLAVTHLPDQTSNNSIGFLAILGCIVFFIPVATWERAQKRPKGIVFSSTESGGKWCDSAFIIGLIIIGLNRLSMSSVTSFFSLYLVEELHTNAISLMNAIAGASEFGAMIFAGIMLQRRKILPVQLLMISGAAMMVRLCIYALFPTFSGALVAQFLHSLCYGFFNPAAVYLVARRVKRSHRTLGMSMYISLGIGLPTVLGSSLGGIIVEKMGYKVLFSSFALFALASLLMCIVFYRTMTKPPIEET